MFIQISKVRSNFRTLAVIGIGAFFVLFASACGSGETATTPPDQVVTMPEPAMPEPAMPAPADMGMDMVTTPPVMLEPETPEMPETPTVTIPVQPIIETQTVTMPEPEMVKIDLNFEVMGSGTVIASCGNPCYVPAGVDAEITVTAVPDDGYYFANWIFCQQGNFCNFNSDVLSNPVVITRNQIRFLQGMTAFFSNEQFGITIDNSEVGGMAIASCEPNCFGSFNDIRINQLITVSAYPNNGYRFSHWECEKISGLNGCFAFPSAFPSEGDVGVSIQNLTEPIITTVIAPSHPAVRVRTSNVNFDGVVRLKPIFTNSPGALQEINSPTEFESQRQVFNYTVLNLTSNQSMKNTELYERIAEYSVNAWVSLNSNLSFNKVSSDSPELNLQIAYLDDDVVAKNGYHGVFCDTQCDESYNLGEISSIVVSGTAFNDDIFFDDQTMNVCVENGRSIGLPTGVTFVTMHELGHAFGLDHHFATNNLLAGDPTGEIPFNYLGLHIPNRVQFGLPLSGNGSVEFNLSNPKPETDIMFRFETLRDLVSREHHETISNIGARRQQEYDNLRLQLLCGDLLDHDHSHPHSHPHP